MEIVNIMKSIMESLMVTAFILSCRGVNWHLSSTSLWCWKINVETSQWQYI